MMSILRNIFPLKKENSPGKLCQVCGDMIPMTRRLARDWEQIQFCSAVCRRNSRTPQQIARAS